MGMTLTLIAVGAGGVLLGGAALLAYLILCFYDGRGRWGWW
jgi:hypothetical protein